ncbi:MAG TPA: FtsQ-type POTRA domain-containing protein [Chroococcidiopsis sp.]
MTDFTYISERELAERRKQLKWRRRWKLLQSIWRTLLVMAMAVAAVWVITLPGWVIRSPEQVVIEGNELLSPQTIYAILPIRYPQSLLMVQPEAIAQALESKAPIASATITRHLFPPHLTVRIQERYPVAIAYPAIANADTITPQQREQAQASQVALLDEKGFSVSMDRYANLQQQLELPHLKVFGMRDEYRTQWVSLYQAIARSPIKISEVNWRDPTNLILNTELGYVHLGPYSDRLPDQLRALDQLRNLPEKMDINQVIYIDLINPDIPLVQKVAPQNSDESDQDPPQ